jgi:hypothetical protein
LRAGPSARDSPSQIDRTPTSVTFGECVRGQLFLPLLADGQHHHRRPRRRPEITRTWNFDSVKCGSRHG